MVTWSHRLLQFLPLVLDKRWEAIKYLFPPSLHGSLKTKEKPLAFSFSACWISTPSTPPLSRQHPSFCLNVLPPSPGIPACALGACPLLSSLASTPSHLGTLPHQLPLPGFTASFPYPLAPSLEIKCAWAAFSELVLPGINTFSPSFHLPASVLTHHKPSLALATLSPHTTETLFSFIHPP